MNQKHGVMGGSRRRWIALSCAFLVLAFAGLEATHAHSDARMARGSCPCAICISVHGNSPALTADILPVLFTVDAVTLPYHAQGQAVAAGPTLFIRPPPAIQPVSR